MSRGRVFIALILLSRVGSFSIGCGPRDGSIGGKCTTHTDACTGRTSDHYCDDGICDPSGGHCVEAPPQAPEPPYPHCDSIARGPCFANQILFRCVDDASPDAVNCGFDTSEGPGIASYCCTPPASSCYVEDASPCGAPSQFFACAYEIAPAVVLNDASLACVELTSYQEEGNYCCASGDACFSVPNEDWCGANRTAYFCPGSTPPDADACVRMDTPKAPKLNGLEAYCCDTPATLDAGGD